jgi:hypothetical protein
MSATLVHKRLSWLRLSELVFKKKSIDMKKQIARKVEDIYITPTNNDLDYLTAVWL